MWSCMDARGGCVKFLLVLFLTFAMAGCVSAVSLTVSNSNFQSGSDDSSASNWTETSDVYYKPAEGNYNETGTIMNRAASFKGSGVAAIYQNISGVYTDSYDMYKITFDIGYRCDAYVEGDVDAFRVSIWDSYSNYEVAGEDIIIGEPSVDSSQSPNVTNIISRTIILYVGRYAQSHHQMALRFSNLDSTTHPNRATVVVDNVSLNAYLIEGAWGLNNSLEDSTLENHDGSALPARTVSYSSSGTGGTSCLTLSRTGNNRGVSVPYSSDLNGENFTVTAWAYVNNSSLSYYRAVISSRNAGTSSNRSGYVIYATPSAKWSFRTGSGATDGWDELGDSISDASVTTGQWTFVTITFGKTGDFDSDEIVGTKRLYINGNLVGTKENVRFRRVNSSLAKPLLIGAGANESTSYDYFFDGKIDDVRYYNYRLTSAEIADIYTNVKGYSTPPSVGSYFNVMTYNVKSFNYHSDSLSRIRDIINDYGPYVVCLQEVKNDSGQLAWLAGQVGMNYYKFLQTDEDYDNYGIAIMSFVPILTYNKYDLPQYDEEEERKLMVCSVEILGRVYTIANTHFAHDSAEAKLLQAESVINTLAYSGGPIILFGDFNFKRWHAPFDILKHSFVDSFPLAATQVDEDIDTKIDFIAISHNTFNDDVYYAERVTNSDTAYASDHYPVVTTFQLLP